MDEITENDLRKGAYSKIPLSCKICGYCWKPYCVFLLKHLIARIVRTELNGI